jgi:hypothetical protein
MELLVYALIVGVVIWYFGGALNSIVQGAGKEASSEFEVFQAESRFRRAKSYDKLGNDLSKADFQYGKKDILGLLDKLEGVEK